MFKGIAALVDSISTAAEKLKSAAKDAEKKRNIERVKKAHLESNERNRERQSKSRFGGG